MCASRIYDQIGEEVFAAQMSSPGTFRGAFDAMITADDGDAATVAEAFEQSFDERVGVTTATGEENTDVILGPRHAAAHVGVRLAIIDGRSTESVAHEQNLAAAPSTALDEFTKPGDIQPRELRRQHAGDMQNVVGVEQQHAKA